MKIESIYSEAFRPYGRVLEGYDTAAWAETLHHTPLPESGTAYRPSEPTQEALPVFAQLRDHAFGGLPIQIGCCNGRNRTLNCLEYHRDSELNLGDSDFILLLARQQEIENGKLDTAKVRAFQVPKGVLVEVYATTLHYAPCSVREGEPFRVAVVLPRGTNEAAPVFTPCTPEDRLLRAANKWLLAHPDSSEAGQGAYVGLTGENIHLTD